MALKLFPEPFPCLAGGHRVFYTSKKEIDCDRTKCPFTSTMHERVPDKKRCCTSAKSLAYELEALGYGRLSSRLYQAFRPEETVRFGRRLLRLAWALRKRHAKKPAHQRPNGSENGYSYDAENGIWRARRCTSFDDALAAIEAGGIWFIKVGQLRSGIRVEY